VTYSVLEAYKVIEPFAWIKEMHLGLEATNSTVYQFPFEVIPCFKAYSHLDHLSQVDLLIPFIDLNLNRTEPRLVPSSCSGGLNCLLTLDCLFLVKLKCFSVNLAGLNLLFVSLSCLLGKTIGSLLGVLFA